MTNLSPERLIALAMLDRVADGPPRDGRWTWSNADDYNIVQRVIIDTDAVVEQLPPLRQHILRSAVVHVLACAEWYIDALVTGADDDARIALESAIDALPFLCPISRRPS